MTEVRKRRRYDLLTLIDGHWHRTDGEQTVCGLNTTDHWLYPLGHRFIDCKRCRPAPKPERKER